jgi:hypothetical protein
LQGANTQLNQLLPQQVSAVSGYAPSVSGQVQNITNQAVNNPYAGQAVTGAQQAGGYGTGTLAPQQQGSATSLFNTAGAAGGYVPQALATGFDPNNAVYNQQYQKMLDQQNAINAMTGVANTPYGAGVTGSQAQNFNTNWLANEQARQQAAASTAGTLATTQGNAATQGGQVGQAGMNTETTASALPYTTTEQQALNALQTLTAGTAAVGGATGATSDVLNSILQYLGYGTQAGTAQQQQSNATYSGIGQGLGGLFGLNTGGGGTLAGDILGAL